MQRILGWNVFCAQWARGLALQVVVVLVFFLTGPTAFAQELYERALDAIARHDRQEATDLLAQLVQQQPDHAGAWLDMAMLYCGAGYASQAMMLFDALERRFAPPPGILELIKLQRAAGCQPHTFGDDAAPVGLWGWQVGRGFESNANQGVRDLNVVLHSAGGPLALQLTPDAAPQSDGLTTLGLDASWPLGAAGAQALVQLQGRWFDTLKRFDAEAMTFVASQPWVSADWRGQVQASASWMNLGSVLYQRSGSLRLAASPRRRLPVGWQANVSGGLSYTQYPTVQNFDAHWIDVRGTLAYVAPAWGGQLGAGVQRDVPLGARPGGARQGWSAEGALRWPVGRTVVAEVGATLQSWQDEQLYAPGLIDQQRVQRTVSARAALIWPAGQQGEWVLEARQLHNNENIDLFGYDALSLRLGYQWRFGQREK